MRFKGGGWAAGAPGRRSSTSHVPASVWLTVATALSGVRIESRIWAGRAAPVKSAARLRRTDRFIVVTSLGSHGTISLERQEMKWRACSLLVASVFPAKLFSLYPLEER